MYIKMDKLQEDSTYVWYSFATNIVGEPYLRNGKTRYTSIPKYGVCKFNKQTEEFETDKEKTDVYFFLPSSRELLFVKVRLMQNRREGRGFPDIIDIATG
jgi:hypothetical protein